MITVFTNANILDVIGETTIKNGSVLVEDGTIKEVGANIAVPEGAKVVDLGGKTMLSEPVPLVIRNAPTGLMKDLDYGKGYVYAHDTKDKIADMECLPESLAGTRYYLPQDAGEETKQKERLEEVMRWRAEQRKRRPD